jgi:monoterpene epsilon-lactone hydrolase
VRTPELELLTKQLRESGLDIGAPADEVRPLFEAMLAGIPVAPDVTFTETSAGGVPALESTTPTASADRVVLYLHGGAYVFGSPTGYRALSAGLAHAAGARGLSLDYRLAPEHPFPAAVDDALAAYRALLDGGVAPGSLAVAGDSAGGGLTIALLVAARGAGLPMPAAAAVLSPWADLALAGHSLAGKAADDPSLTRDGLATRAAEYLGGADAATPLASPVHADLHGLPPLLIQVGSAEILLDDATRLAARAGADEVETRLEVWPHMVHVFQTFGFLLAEGRAAVTAAGEFLAGHFGEE